MAQGSTDPTDTSKGNIGLAISRHILTLTSLVSRESFFGRNP